MKQISLYKQICNLGIISVIEGLDKFGSVWTVENICQSIEERDESFKDFLVSLNTYGAYDMLVAICEIVDLFCSKDIQNWFYEQLRQCPDSEMILRMTNTFYKRRVTELQKICNEFHESNIILAVNVPQFEIYIWESYDSDFLRKIARNNPRNIGVWFPVIYVNSHIGKYMNKLEECAFPYLIMCAKDIREVDREDKVQEALVRMRITDYLIELGLLYYSKIERAIDPLIEMDPKLVAEFDSNEYAQTIQNILEKELGYRLYITDGMTDYLSEMINKLCVLSRDRTFDRKCKYCPYSVKGISASDTFEPDATGNTARVSAVAGRDLSGTLWA